MLNNNQIKFCKNCLHFKPYYIKDGIFDLDKCKKFEILNSKEIIYEYAHVCRKDKNKCGENATQFEEIK